MIDSEYQKYINEQPLDELKKIALRINKLHFPDEFNSVVKRISELEGENFDEDFYFNPKMKDALHLEITSYDNSETRLRRSKYILTAFLITFSFILSINIFNLIINGNLLSIIPVVIYIALIIMNINRSKVFGKACKIWAALVVVVTVTIKFKDFLNLNSPEIINFLHSLAGSNQIIQPTAILLAAGILIFYYANHIYTND
ncbi:MAG: hypothetical protein ACEPO8_00115 [Rhodothermaceae bacterium]